MISPERSPRLFPVLFRLATRLLPRADREVAGEMTGLATALVRAERRERGRRAALRAATACLIDVAMRAARARQASPSRTTAVRFPRSRSTLMQDVLQDLRVALRGFAARPGFALTAILTLAIGIGANTAIFSVAHAVLRSPLPFRDDERLARVYMLRDDQPPYISPGAEIYVAVADAATSFEGIVGQRYTSLTLATDAGPVRIGGMAVTDGWLETLGISLHSGRSFTAAESLAGRGSGVVLVSHRLWQERYGGDPEILGSSLLLDGAPATVVGILPPGFQYPYDNDLYFPLNARDEIHGRWGFNAQARLAPGVTLEQANAEMRALSVRLRETVPSFVPELTLVLVPTREVLLDDGEGLVLGLMAAVGFVLLVACANVATMMLARSLTRRRELAIRAALGAGRRRQLRLLLTESLALGIAGGLVGLAVAIWTRDLLLALVPGRIGNLLPAVPIDPYVLAFCAALSVLTALVFGLPIALRALRADPGDLLRGGGRSATASDGALLDLFVVAEIAVVLVLLLGAGVTLSNLSALRGADFGYDPEGVVTMQVQLDEERYGEAGQRARFSQDLREVMGALPGIDDAGTTSIFPSAAGNFISLVALEGQDEEHTRQANRRIVSPGFLETLGVELLQGRMLDSTDAADNPDVAIVSSVAAVRFWPGEQALGKRFRERGSPDRWLTVVGIVDDLMEFDEIEETIYLPLAQHGDRSETTVAVIAARAQSLSPEIVDQLRQAVWRVDPTLAVFEVATANELYAQTLTDERMGTTLLGLFAAFALVLGSLGLYSMTAFAVARRMHEIGIRLAMGAAPDDVVLWVLRRSLLRAGIGVFLGLGLAVLLGQLARGLVTEVSPLDPIVVGSVCVVLAVVSVLASWLPARRATRIDPAAVLKGV